MSIIPSPGPGELLVLTRPRLADYPGDGATVQRRADEIFAALEDGTLRLEISGRYTLDEVEIAHAALEDRRHPRRHCLRPGRPIDLLPLQGMGG